MKRCKRIRRFFFPYLAEELPLEDRQRVEAHLQDCPACRDELRLHRLLDLENRDLAAEVARQEGSIPWDEIPDHIMARLLQARIARVGREKEKGKGRAILFSPPRLLATAALLAAMAALWIIHPWNPEKRGEPQAVSAATINRFETSISRDQLIEYLGQSQLILTDMLKQCQDAPPNARDLGVQSQQVQSLLQKRKYLQSEFSRLELAKAEPVCRQIDLLFYDIVQLSPENSCSDIERIQRMIKKENLLLKIRLLEKDLTYPQEREV